MTDSTSTPKQYRLSIRRPVTVAMLFLTLMVFGWKSYDGLSLNLMPDISYPTLTVRTEYEGAAPDDVMELVTQPLEERLSVVSGVVEITSTSSAGLSEIILEFAWTSDMNIAMQDVRESLDAFNAPQGVTRRPIILRYDPTLDPIMRVAIRGRDYSGQPDAESLVSNEITAIREATRRQLKNDLEAEVGIAQVAIQGGLEEEIQVMLDTERLKILGLTLEDVSRALDQQNINFSGGRLKEGKTEFLVRTLNEFRTVEEIRDVMITIPAGGRFRLADIASVEMGTKERQTIVRVNGLEAVQLEIFKEGSANTVVVCNMLKDFFSFERKPSAFERFRTAAAERMPEERRAQMLQEMERKKKVADKLKSRLPSYAKPILITDQSRFIEASIREVQQTAIIGGILALCILFLFLKELRSTLIIGVAIPISVVATFIPMFMQNVSLNIMSLGGLALGVGMLVDNSIVVLESIFRCKEEGDSQIDAAERGTKEVASAVVASTLTTIAVFAPIIFVQGIAGQLFRDLTLTVGFSLIASLLVALYLIPMIASRQGKVASVGSSTVWLLSAFAENRASGTGRIGALMDIPKRGLGFVREWLVDAYNESLRVPWRGVRGIGAKEGERVAPLGRVGFGILLPIVAALYVLQAILKIAATFVITILFSVLSVVLGALWVIGWIIGKILYIPVSLFDRLFNALRGVYVVVLRQALHFSPILLLAIAALAAHASTVALNLGRELLPPLKQGEFGIRIEAPPGTRLEDTEKRARLISDIVSSMPHVGSVTMKVGSEGLSADVEEGENVAHITVKLENPEENVRHQDMLIEEMRDEVMRSTADSVTFTLPALFSFKTAIELQIYGEDLDELERLGQRATYLVGQVEGVKDAELSLKEGYPEVHITLDRGLLAEKGLSPSLVGQRIGEEVSGTVATRFNQGGEKKDILVRTDISRMESVDDLKNMSVGSGTSPLALREVATLSEEKGPSEIRRIDQRQVVLVTANVEGRDLGSVARDIETLLADELWPEGYDYTMGGQQRELETSYAGLVFAMIMAIFLVYVVMACQFESLWHPALIMFTVPLAFIGVIYVLDFLDVHLSVVVFIGAIVLAGIVVNAAIVLVDYINQLRARGLTKVEAIVQAGSVRFRPIIMTTLTTMLGLIPMAMSVGEGAEMRRPMAITVIAGLGSATVLTLIIIPVVYYVAGGRDRRDA